MIEVWSHTQAYTIVFNLIFQKYELVLKMFIVVGVSWTVELFFLCVQCLLICINVGCSNIQINEIFINLKSNLYKPD